MKKRKTINCTVLMAGAYPIQKGKKISVQKRGDLFFASSEGVDFGLIKDVCEEEEEQILSLPEVFDGIVVENCCEQHLLTICVALQDKRREKRKWRNTIEAHEKKVQELNQRVCLNN